MKTTLEKTKVQSEIDDLNAKIQKERDKFNTVKNNIVMLEELQKQQKQKPKKKPVKPVQKQSKR